jgi:general secretion pathway protein D
VLRTTASLLTSLIAVALVLSAALVLAQPVPQDSNAAFDRAMAGPSAGTRFEDKRLQADDLLRRARRAMAENDFASAAELVDQAEALNVQYSPLYLGDTPRSLRRDLARKMDAAGKTSFRSGSTSRAPGASEAAPPDPFLARGAAPAASPADPKSLAKQCILRARKELDAGNLQGAAYWHREAVRQQARFGPNEDSPERLAADIRSRGGLLDDLPASTAGRGSRNVIPLPPVDEVSPRELLLAARRALAVGDVARARDKVQRARASGAAFSPGDDAPEKVEAAIFMYSDVMSQKSERGNTDAWRRQYAKVLMDQADALLRWRDFDEAERLAQAAVQQRASFNTYEVRPEVLLDQIAAARRQTPLGPLAGGRGDVVPAGADVVLPAIPGAFDRGEGAVRAVYDPRNDLTRNIRASASEPAGPGGGRLPAGAGASPPAGSALALFQQGEMALKEHDTQTALQLFRQAYQRVGELDPGTARRLQELLTLLSPASPGRPGAPPTPAVDDVIGKQQLAATQMTVTVGNQIVSARTMREMDPKGAIALLEQARAKVDAAGLDQVSRDHLFRRLDAALAETRQFIAENRPRLDLEERNQRVRQEIDREQQAAFDRGQKLEQKVEEFNNLMRDRSFAQAEVVAKQALELAPDDRVANQLVITAKMMRHWANAMATKSDKEEGFLKALESVDVASVPFDDRNPIVWPDPKDWRDLTGRRSRYAKDATRRFSERELEIQQKLKTPVSVQFENAPLAKVLEELGRLANVNIYLDQQGLLDEGVSTDTPVNIDLRREVKLESALNLILKDFRLGYVVKNEVLNITSARNCRGAVYVKTYNVADLVIPIPNFVGGQDTGLQAAYRHGMAIAGMGNMASTGPGGTAMPVVLASSGSRPLHGAVDPAVLAQVSGTSNRGSVPTNMPLLGGPGGMGGGSMADFDSLIQLIQNTVATDSWQDVGGAATIEPFEANLSLVISQTEETHAEISALLEQLRRMQDLQVTIEVRFITLNDNFFERIGLDFDMNINDNINHPGMVWGAMVSPGQVGPQTAPTTTGGTNQQQVAQGFGPIYNTGQGWREFGREPSALVGLASAGTATSPAMFTADLDIPFTQNSFSLAVPQFGGFDPSAGMQMGFAILSEVEAYFFISAAQGDRRTNVLQAPKVTLFNGQMAQIYDMTQVPFVMGIIPVVGEFAAAQQPVIVVLNEGTYLSVQAVVSNDKRFVRMTIIPYFSSIGDVSTFTFTGETTTTTDSSQQGNQDQPNDNTKKSSATRVRQSGTTVQQPSFSTTTVSTTVSVPDGGTILLGGIKRLREGRTEAGVPILNKIPYINRLFKNVGMGRETSSLMMMVTPRIIIQEEEEEKLGIATTPP